ncbi:MAG TPA: hypothetical protein VHC22_18285 [Pirellulales bacterium]|nr:hypothetical protein [Pirellulales bacterium]
MLGLQPHRAHAAASGTTVTSAAKGIALTVSTQWLDGSGYRPIQVAVAPTTPLLADQTLHLEFHAKLTYYPGNREIAVSQDIELPAGSTGVVDTIAVPQYFPFHQFNVEVWLNGRYSSKLSQRGFGGAGIKLEGLPNVLVVGSPVAGVAGAPPTITPFLPDPDSSRLVSIFPGEATQQQYYGVAIPPTAPGTKASLPTLITVPYDRLPRRWIELSSIDIVCLKVGELDRLAASEPERCQALRQWLLAGGNVIVFDVGPEQKRADDAARLLAPNESLDNGLIAESWTKPNVSDFQDRLKTYGTNQTPSVSDAAAPSPDQSPFRLRRFGDGMVVAADTDDLFAQPAQHWIWMLNSVGTERWLWYRRHGTSYDRKNGDFWNWLVRGVGMAPVTEFRVLITVFVLAIGPLNYFWLRRRRRLHLLVVVVPLAACAVTFGLFGYAIVADGLDVRVRARTFTRLDQRSGQATCWSRLSYYAGLAPSGGLVFPDDVVVFPLTANDDDSSDMLHRQNLIWSAHKQELVSGWVASRTPAQFITVRSRVSQAGLRYVPPRASAAPEVENQLGSRVIRLLLTDENGRHYRAADIAPGGRASLTPVDDPSEEEADIYDFVVKHQPGVPEGFVPPSSYGYRARRRYYYAGTNLSLPAPSAGTNRLEVGLREAVIGAGKGSWSKPAGFSLPKRSYLALVERSPEVVFGVDAPREEDSLHVVVGTW